jgi:DNA-directed RNA polymerase specialized sigma24 family protein
MDHLPQRGDGRLPAADRMWAAGLRTRHGDLIGRYVSRRTDSPHQAAAILDSVFQAAAEQRDRVPAHALPWLIATARRECAAVRRAAPPTRSSGAARVRHLRTA